MVLAPEKNGAMSLPMGLGGSLNDEVWWVIFPGQCWCFKFPSLLLNCWLDDGKDCSKNRLQLLAKVLIRRTAKHGVTPEKKLNKT